MDYKLVRVADLPQDARNTTGPSHAIQRIQNPVHIVLIQKIESATATDAGLWKRVHEGLMRSYAPVWEYIDARDVLVAWSGAGLALNKANREHERLSANTRNITRRQRITIKAREADISFWSRCLSNLSGRAALALEHDDEAVNVLQAFLDRA